MSVESGLKPSTFIHCESVYERMKEQAKTVHEDGVPLLIWEGFMTKLFRDLKLATPYYSSVRNALLGMGCIKQLRRGGGNSMSQWELIKPPTMSLYEGIPEPEASGPLGGSDAALHQRVQDLIERVKTLEKNQSMIVELFNQSKDK